MSDPRPSTPSWVEERLRQEAGFGCCKCGRPFFQYHHIVPWEQERHFRPEDMMTLCPNCHDEAGKGGMPEAEQRRFKANPHNVKHGNVYGFVRIPQGAPAVDVGSVMIVNDGPILSFGESTALALAVNERGGLSVSLDLKDKDGRNVLTIVNNEWVASQGVWDFEAGYRRLKLRERKYKIMFEMDGTSWPLKVRGHFWHDKRRFSLRNNEVDLGAQVRISEVALGACYLSLLGVSHTSKGETVRFSMVPDPRRNRAMMFSGFVEEKDALTRACEWFTEISNQPPLPPLRSVKA